MDDPITILVVCYLLFGAIGVPTFVFWATF